MPGVTNRVFTWEKTIPLKCACQWNSKPNLCVTFYKMPSTMVTPRKFTFTDSRATPVGCDPYCFALGSVGSPNYEWRQCVCVKTASQGNHLQSMIVLFAFLNIMAEVTHSKRSVNKIKPLPESHLMSRYRPSCLRDVCHPISHIKNTILGTFSRQRINAFLVWGRQETRTY